MIFRSPNVGFSLTMVNEPIPWIRPYSTILWQNEINEKECGCAVSKKTAHNINCFRDILEGPHQYSRSVSAELYQPLTENL